MLYYISVNESWNEDLEPDLHLEENISNLDISGIFDFTPTNSIQKRRKGSNTYCTINEVDKENSLAPSHVKNISNDKDAESNKMGDNSQIHFQNKGVTQDSLNFSKSPSNSKEQFTATEKRNLIPHHDTNESKLQDKALVGQAYQNIAINGSSKSGLSRITEGNTCENISNVRPSPVKTQQNEDKTRRICSSSHALNTIKSNSIIDTISPIFQTGNGNTENQHHYEVPNRLLRSASTSTCSALYSPLLKDRQNHDLRFLQQNGRYSDTICSRYRIIFFSSINTNVKNMDIW